MLQVCRTALTRNPITQAARVVAPSLGLEVAVSTYLCREAFTSMVTSSVWVATLMALTVVVAVVAACMSPLRTSQVTAWWRRLVVMGSVTAMVELEAGLQSMFTGSRSIVATWSPMVALLVTAPCPVTRHGMVLVAQSTQLTPTKSV